MNLDERIKRAEKKAKEAAKDYFKEKPQDIKDELEKETILGSAENLIESDNKDE